MSGGQTISIDNFSPTDVWSTLKDNPKSALVDCRTKEEWATIGTPDLSSIDRDVHLIEWRMQPSMTPNPSFLDELDAALGETYPDQLFFICRSGARSLEAAAHVQNIISSRHKNCVCINVAEGFEGDPGPSGARATLNGWKFNNLPWQKG